MISNDDYRDKLLALSEEKVKYLIIGAFAVAAHGIPRATLDLDIWVSPDPVNAGNLYRALAKFGAPVEQIDERDLASERIRFQIGVPPRRIDITTTVTGLQFDAVYPDAIQSDCFGIGVRVLGINALLKNKKATGRSKDLIDVEVLEQRALKGKLNP